MGKGEEEEQSVFSRSTERRGLRMAEGGFKSIYILNEWSFREGRQRK